MPRGSGKHPSAPIPASIPAPAPAPAASYPEPVEQKDALSAALFTQLTAEQKKAFTSAATKGGAWEAKTNASYHLAELYYRRLRNDSYDSCISELSAELSLSGAEFSKRVNQKKKLVEPLASCAHSISSGDLWFCRSLSRHTAVFVQPHMGPAGLDPNRTIMGHAFMRRPGKHGGTGAFQLVTLAQLREFSAACLAADGQKPFVPQDEWVMRRSLFVPRTQAKNIEPYEKPYPKDLQSKIDLSAELFQAVQLEPGKLKVAYAAIQKQGWTSEPGSSLSLAEAFASQLTGVSLGTNVTMFMGHHGGQLAAVWNAQARCVEPLASGGATVEPGDLWFYEKPATHTAVFIKVVYAGASIDPSRTIMGHGLKRDMSTAGGTGRFQLLTLSQLRECMSARLRTCDPKKEWLVHRLQFPAGA